MDYIPARALHPSSERWGGGGAHKGKRKGKGKGGDKTREEAREIVIKLWMGESERLEDGNVMIMVWYGIMVIIITRIVIILILK